MTKRQLVLNSVGVIVIIADVCNDLEFREDFYILFYLLLITSMCVRNIPHLIHENKKGNRGDFSLGIPGQGCQRNEGVSEAGSEVADHELGWAGKY